MRESEELVEMASDGVKLALSRGADAAEVFVSESRSTRVFAAGRRITGSQTADFGLGVRILSGGRMGISGASRPDGLALAIDRALASVKDIAARGDVASFPAPSRDPHPRVATDPRLADDRSESLGLVAHAIMEAALSANLVSYSQLTVASGLRRIGIASSTGHAAWDESATEKAELELRCTRGTTHRGGSSSMFSRAPLDLTLDAAKFAGALAERLVSALESHPLLAPVDEAILLPSPLGQIVRMTSASLCARVTPQGVAAPAGALGASLYSEAVSLADEPRGPSGIRRRNVDDEGVPTRTTSLVEAGKLAGILHDARTAALSGGASTGNGMRGSAANSVAPAAINLAMRAGDASLDELIQSARRAVLVTEPLLGGFTHNKSTGDFSVVVPYAFLVEAGRVKHALPPTTIGGNAHRVLREVRAVGKERATTGNGTLPPVRAGGVSCAT